MPAQEKILVIKLGAFGDFVQSLGPMAAIRRHHPDSHITLLTTKPFVLMAEQCGYFNEIHVDSRPRWPQVGGVLDLMEWLRAGNFTRVYDLQNNDRTAFYLKLFGRHKKPEWVGAAKGASHRNDSPQRTAGSAFDGHVQTLALAGITDVKIDKLDWVNANLSPFPLRRPYVLLIPGCSPQHPEKRWPARHYGRLAQIIAADGYQPVILGTEEERAIAAEILPHCPEALDLTGQTAMLDIAGLARQAAFCIGNDTGPVHMAAATGCPTLALFSPRSNPVKHGPKGDNVKILQTQSLETLKPEKVLRLFRPRYGALQKNAILH
jgi:ADP-heptose:LPS heptosyltransferase